MKYLLDTHVLLWIITNDSKLSLKAKTIYLDPENDIYFSLAGVWEMAIKSSLGKLSLSKQLDKFIDEHIKGNNIEILKIEVPHVVRVENLPFHHRDPFDRLMISQAIVENLPLMSADRVLDAYPIKRVW